MEVKVPRWAVGGGGPTLAGADGRHYVSSGVVVQAIEVDRAIAFIAQQLDEGGASLLLRRLQVPVVNPQQVHLQRLDQKILCVSAIPTRQWQTTLRSSPKPEGPTVPSVSHSRDVKGK